MTRKLNFAMILKVATSFEKAAQKISLKPVVTVSADPMRKDLDRLIAKKVEDLANKFLNEKAVSSLQVNINYQNPNTANFVIYAGGTDKEVVEKEMAIALSGLGPAVAKIISKYQQEPMDYKYTEYQV